MQKVFRREQRFQLINYSDAYGYFCSSGLERNSQLPFLKLYSMKSWEILMGALNWKNLHMPITYNPKQ